MKMLLQKPPNYDEVAAFFKLDPGQAIFFTYGDTVYNPGMVKISEDLIRHEETHIEQQEANSEVADLWWKRYLRDPEFRIQEEAEAYGNQYAFMCARNHDRNYQARYLHEIAGHLSGPVYGNAISRQDAAKLIKTYAQYGRKDIHSTPSQPVDKDH